MLIYYHDSGQGNSHDMQWFHNSLFSNNEYVNSILVGLCSVFLSLHCNIFTVVVSPTLKHMLVLPKHIEYQQAELTCYSLTPLICPLLVSTSLLSFT